MSYTLTDNDRAMIKASAYGLDGSAEADFLTGVNNELSAVLAGGVAITKNHVKSAITTVRMRRGM